MQKSVLALFTLAAACGGLSDGRTPTGSATLASSADRSALYALHEHDALLSRVDLTTSAVRELELPGQPMRITRARGKLLVSLGDARSLAVVADRGGELVLERTIAVGAEPAGLVTNEEETRVYLAEATENQIVELDAETLAPLRSWRVEGEPRWLALHPSGESLYVLPSFGFGAVRIDLDAGETEPVTISPPTQFGDNGAFTLEGRFTGDPAVSPDGERLVLPALFVDTTTEIAENEQGESPTPGGGYDRGGRFNPAIVVIGVDGDGTPEGEEPELITLMGAGAVGYPTSLSVAPDSKSILVTMEGAGSVAVVQMPGTREESRNIFDVFSSNDSLPREERGSFLRFENMIALRTGAGPNGAVFVGERDARVLTFLERGVEKVPMDEVYRSLGIDADDRDDGRDLAIAVPGAPAFGFEPAFGSTTDVVSLAKSRLPADVERGRRMFFAANDARMATVSAGVSCATCHFRGRNDGFTWRFTRGPRQTPSLAGKVSLNAPVRWEGDRETVAEDAMRTSQGLMGGQGLSVANTLDIEAFVDWTRDVDLPKKGAEDERARRGKALFESARTGCAECHSGARYSDKKRYRLFGVEVQTRSLVGVAATAPYFHDGSQPTLRAVLEASRTNGMGTTATLNDAEMDDLLYYLETL